MVPLIGPLAAIKLVNLPFVMLMATAVYKIVGLSSAERSSARLAAAALCVTPTVLVNAFLWGQADSIYTSFVAWFVLFAMRQSPHMALAMFGVALSFKFQTIFVSPLLLYLLLSRQVQIQHLLIVPLVYVLMMVPAALAGRPWVELLGVYAGQVQSPSPLSEIAPNPWHIIQRLNLIDYPTGLVIGLAAATLAGLAIAIGSLRLERTPSTTLLIAALCGALMPYLLPKMHERYFFVADVLTLALAFAVPRLWLPAVLFQLGSIAAYLSYFGVYPGALYGFLPVTFAVGLLVLAYMQARLQSRVLGSLIRFPTD